MSNENIVESSASTGIIRRSIVKGAAWSVPVVSLAVAAPMAAASTLAEATWWYLGSVSGVSSGNVTRFNIEGVDADAQTALLPAGSTIVITPDAGVTIQLTNITGATWNDNGDGIYTATIEEVNVSLANIFVRVNGALGLGVTAVANVPNVAPFTDERRVLIV